MLIVVSLGIAGPGVAQTDEGLDELLGDEGAQRREESAPSSASREDRPSSGAPREAAPASTDPPAVAAPESSQQDEGDAAQAPRPSSRSIEEIVVTARKIEENIQDVPVAVTAISAADLEETSTFELRELHHLVPNMEIRYGSGQPTAVVYQIRGQVQTDILGTLDPSIGFYEDGIYIARPRGANVSFVDVEDVQVLRGPQGTLFGRNTTGGAILLDTNDPDFEAVSGSLGATIGSFGRRQFTAVLNAPLVSDTFALRIAGQTLDTDGYAFDRTNQREIATQVHDLVRVKLRYQPFEGLRFTLKGQHFEVDQLGQAFQPLFALKPQEANPEAGLCCLAYLSSQAEGVEYDDFIGGDPDRVDLDPDHVPVSEIIVRGLTLKGEHDLPWMTAKLFVGLRQNEDNVEHPDFDGTPSIIIRPQVTTENLEQSYELQLTGSLFDHRLGWTAGAVFFDEDGKEHATSLFTPALLGAINPIRTLGDVQNRSIGGYAQAAYSITERLRVTGGVRYSIDRKRLVLSAFFDQVCSLPENMRDDGTTCVGTFDDTFDNVSWLFSTDYRLLEDAWGVDSLLAYLSVSTGYRAGGQNLRGTSEDTLQPFKPETLTNFEMGFKADVLDRQVRLNGAGFYTLYDEIQRTTVLASASALPATVIANAASAEVAGTELELTALTPLEGFELAGSLGVILTKYNEFVDGTGDRSGEPFSDVPKLSYSLSGTYLRDVFNLPWMNRLDWSWTSEVPHSPDGVRNFRRSHGVDLESRANQPPVGILNARSALNLREGLDVGFFAKNITNDRTFNSVVIAGGPDVAVKMLTNAPREVGFDVTYRF